MAGARVKGIRTANFGVQPKLFKEEGERISMFQKGDIGDTARRDVTL
jgi:hypothetical protein